MNATDKPRRRTAANTATLARIKGYFNAAIYRKALEAYNVGGPDACRAYVGGWFNDEAREGCLAVLFGEAD